MKRIENLEQLKQLGVKEKFYVLDEGRVKKYIFCSLNPVADNVVAIPDYDYAAAVTFGKMQFDYGKRVFLQGEYVSAEVGQVMIDQMNERIDSVKEIWMKEEKETN